MIERIRVVRSPGDYDERRQDEDEAAGGAASQTRAKDKGKRKSKSNGGSKRTKRIKRANGDVDILGESDTNESGDDSDDIDNDFVVSDGEAGTGGKLFRPEQASDDDALPPPLNLINGGGSSTQNAKANRRPGPPNQSRTYYVYRVSLTSQNAGYAYQVGLTDAPCGICPVSDICDNRSRPSFEDRSLADIGKTARSVVPPRPKSSIKNLKSVAIGGATETADTARDRTMDSLMNLKPPGSSAEESKIWLGGGTRGKQRVGQVNPSQCVYYKAWLDF